MSECHHEAAIAAEERAGHPLRGGPLCAGEVVEVGTGLQIHRLQVFFFEQVPGLVRRVVRSLRRHRQCWKG